jgi:cbb3-type cytochrome c oxidase subunit III
VLRAAVAGALGAAAVVAAGCGSVAAGQEAGSSTRGKELFVEHCGGCHVLADAGAAGVIGPNLDEAFGHAREQGFDESTIRDLVRGQIAYPVTDPPTGEPGMPANLVTGEDAAAVAGYVASAAGKPGGGEGSEAAPADPKELFVQNCGSCHVLADAGTEGTVGPSLDEAQLSVGAAIEQITNGGGGMPAFDGRLTEEQIRAIAEYVVEASG